LLKRREHVEDRLEYADDLFQRVDDQDDNDLRGDELADVHLLLEHQDAAEDEQGGRDDDLKADEILGLADEDMEVTLPGLDICAGYLIRPPEMQAGRRPQLEALLRAGHFFQPMPDAVFVRAFLQ